jgi:hypothetical protein
LGGGEVAISNIIGEKIHATNIPTSGKQVLDASRFSEGIYFVKIKTSFGDVIRKIVVSSDHFYF